MAEPVVITLLAENGYSQDFELAADLALEKLCPRLLAVLQRQSRMFAGWNEMVLELDGAGLLERSATLLDYGIRSGMYLTAVKKEKYNDQR